MGGEKGKKAQEIPCPRTRVIFEKLASSLLMKLELSRDYMKEIDKLKSTLTTIQAVIEDAEEQQQKDKKVKVWLNQLKEVAFDVDDLLDKLSTQILEKKIKKNKVGLSCLALHPISSLYVMPRKLKGVRQRVDAIAKDMSMFRFRERTVYGRSLTMERRETGPHIDESEVLGRGDDLEAIVSMLLSATPTQGKEMNVSVIPLLGMGGIGKTALAQLAYNDARVRGHFDLRMWVSVYDCLNLRKVVNDILDYATNNKHESSQIGVLQSQLFESLCGKRYLLVLDDVWDDNQEEWEKLKFPLRGGANGSKIIITTRSEKVASVIGTLPHYILGGLAEEECWTLFKQRAFSKGEETYYPKLLPIGRQIVQKCGGVPLAAKILGSLMRFKREESEWLHVQVNELWNLHEEENRILSALRLSYNHLPSHLKRCFTFCAAFPKKFEMTQEKLIRLWIAEGLIQSPGDTFATKKMEDTGREYFNEFLLMSFFQAVYRCDESNTVRFKMHDLILDLAKFLAGSEFCILSQEEAPTNHAQEHCSSTHFNNHAQIRHASVFCTFKSSWIPNTLYAATKLRTFRFFSPRNDAGKVLPSAIRVFTRLRVLDLSCCGIRRLHKSVGALMQLRYLDLSHTLLEALPKSISHLYNLQTLNLSGCHSLIYLPKEISKLINLRHLIVEDCIRLVRMPSVKRLLNLQTLPLFIVGKKFEESLFQLVHLNLRGQLSIKHLENVGNAVPDLCLEEKQLYSLRLSWGNDEAKSDCSSMPSVVRHDNIDHSAAEAQLNCLKPHESLRKLHLNGYLGMVFPQWMNHVMLPLLSELVLINCKSCKELPMLGQLPSLKVINIEGLDGLVNIGREFYGKERNGTFFSSLKQLTLKNLSNLETWESPETVEAFAVLDRLTITRCPSLTTMPTFPSLRHLELQNCNARILRSAAVLNSLYTLVIDVFPELHHLPQGLLQNSADLKALTISSCPLLNSLPWDLRSLVALRSLTIRWCEELSSLSREIRNLTSLENLEITECTSLMSLPEEGIRALERMTIMYCPTLVYLPEEIQHLSALRSLTILSCQELASLPEGLQHVKTLQNLEICSCPSLIELPEWVENLVHLRSLTISDCRKIKFLPEGLKHLRELQHISIRESPHLELRCEKGRGEDWFKISHVTYIYVGSSALKQ